VSHDAVLAAADALRNAAAADPAARTATLEEPVAVLSPGGDLDSWFVALTTDEGLLGFFQLEPDLTLHRYSTFGHPQPASAWLDRNAIAARARTAVAEGDELGEPVLTYRGNRDRLTWLVPIRNRPGAIYVVGDDVEAQPPANRQTSEPA
jgi:hypothetical protein